MASTNKTTYYELSQYTANDKPTYLVDYNSDMSNIDAGIHGVDVKATANTTNIGTMTDLQTTEKTTIVGAVNEVKSSTVANATNIANNTTDIGVLSNLNTTNKSSIVNAINEVDDNVKKFNYTNFKTYNTNEIVVSTGSVADSNLTLARNDDNSLIKFYGQCTISLSNVSGLVSIKLPSVLRPQSDIFVGSLGSIFWFTNTGLNNVYSQGVTFKSNGDIEILITVDTSVTNVRFVFSPCVIFLKDFGDTPTI